MTVERVEEDESMRDAYFRREVGADGRIVLGRSLRRGLLASRQSRTATAAEERRDCIMAAKVQHAGQRCLLFRKGQESFPRASCPSRGNIIEKKISPQFVFALIEGC